MARTTIPISAISAEAQQQLKSSQVYNTIDDLPLSGNDQGSTAYVASTKRLYIWDSGWYNIALINTNPSITGGYESSYLFETDGTPIEITLVGSDPEGIPLTWSYEVTSGSLTNGGGTTATVTNADNVFTITPTTTQDYAGSFSLTFKASDGVNLGTAVSSFTLAFKILNSSYTTLLAKGTAATQNAIFVDSSTSSHTITANGDVYQGTFSPYRAGGYSTYFDGTGDVLYAAENTAFNVGVGDFTFESWIYPTSFTTGNWNTVFSVGNTTNFGGLLVGKTDTNTFCIRQYGTATIVETATLPPLNSWTHIAGVRSSGTSTLYYNGVAVASATDSTNYTTATPFAHVGNSDHTTYSHYFNGYISNPRLVVGTAVYTANFTSPTEPLTAITNTSLLINTSYIADSSTNAHAITVNGNTSMQPFSSFDYEAYDEAINGGSAYFDGTGDYLTTAMDGTFLHACSADWAVEAWVYPTTINSTHTVFGDNISSIKYGVSGYITSSGKFQFAVTRGVSGSYKTVETVDNYIKVNLWCHVAVTFSYSTDTLSLYVNGKLQSTNSSAFSYSSNTSSYPYVLGVYNNGEGGPFYGYIANHRVVNGDTVYTSDFTPPTAPLTAITNTSALLNFTNAGVQDYSQVSDLKLLGNATGSNTQTKNASYSMYMPAGDTNYALIPANTQTTLGTVPFTVEFWMLIPTGYSADSNGRVIEQGIYSSSNTWRINRNLTTNSMKFQIGGSTSRPEIQTTTVMSTNTWYHVAVVRNNSNTITMYINGVSEGTPLLNRTDSFASNDILLGNSVDNNHLECYIEDLRVTKGLARYTASFTPPTSELLG